MKTIHVACGIIEQDGTVLATQRSESMSLPLKWEFPGGKIRENEDPADCLKRELVEELGIVVRIEKPLPLFTHTYPDFTVVLHPFICTIVQGRLTLHEHRDAVWLPPDRLHELDWAEADVPLIRRYTTMTGQAMGDA